MTTRAAAWSLKIADWPAIDRAAWEAACRPGDWLDAAGPGARLRPKSLAKYAENYGHWLAWLSDAGLLDHNTQPADRLDPRVLVTYASWMAERIAPPTVRIRIEDIKNTLALIDPRHDPNLFRALLRRLPNTPVRDKRAKMRDPNQLVATGEKLMATAEDGGFGPPRYNAVGFRDGLLIALAAWRPLRRHNLAGLRLDQHITTRKGRLRIEIPAEETKSNLEINVTWPDALGPALQRYVHHWRPILLGAHKDPGFLWISRWGAGGVADHTIACMFRRHTKAALGVAIGPHAFRDAAATMMAIRDPQNVRAAAAVLGHASYKTTQMHYNLARQLDAVSVLHESIDALELAEGSV